jgi:hypothetical protein
MGLSSASITRPAFLAALRSVGVEVHQEICWVKEGFQFGRADYHWQHESCLYGWRERHTFLGERNQSTVWQIPRQTDHEHPTTKPTALWEIPMPNHLRAARSASTCSRDQARPSSRRSVPGPVPA